MIEDHPGVGVWFSRLVIVLCMLAVAVIGFTQTSEHFDDAYITYRYAHNLAIGRGFVYNPGEAVLGTTAPLYGVLLAIANWLGLDIPRVSHFLGVLSWVALVWLTWQIGCASGKRRFGVLAAVLVATSSLFLQVIGMETNFVIALALGAFLLYLKGHARWAFCVAGLATLVRPDAALVALVLGVAYIWQRRAIPWHEALIYAVVVLPWVGFAQAFYGSPFPNSLLAKAGQGEKPFLGGNESGTFGAGLLRLATDLYTASKLYAAAGFFALVGLAEAMRTRPRWALVVVWSGFYALSYVVLTVSPFHWYYPPLVPAFAFLVAGGIDRLADFLARFRPLTRVSTVMVVLFCTLLIIPQARVMMSHHTTQTSPYHRGYEQVAKWFKANTPAEASVALIEIGLIGYEADRRVVDTMGLVSPDVTRHLYSWYQTLAYAVTRYWPDYAVALQGTAWDQLAQQDWFREAYKPAVTIPSAGPGSRTATIYRRADDFPVRNFALVSAPDLMAGDVVRLSKVQLQSAQLEPGAPFHVLLDWSALDSTAKDYKVTLALISLQNGDRLWFGENQPMHGGNPTFLWRPGEVIADPYSLRVPADLKPGAYLLEVGLTEAANAQALSFQNAAGQGVPHVVSGPVWVGRPISADQGITVKQPATFGPSIDLLGYDLSRSTYRPGEMVDLALYWTVNQPVRDDYTVFVHITDASGRLVAQEDHFPLQGKFPTSLLLPDVTLQDRYQIRLPDNLDPGELTILVGLYKLETGERLPVSSATGESADNALRLADLVVP